jgi:hypothetical protein
MMEELEIQQVEALKAASSYCTRLSVAIKQLITEYSKGERPDTDQYMKSILNGLNWVFQVFRSTEGIVNKDEVHIDKNQVNQYVLKLNTANKQKDNTERVAAFTGILSFVDSYRYEADRITSQVNC